ncbi:MAG: DapH/DapD/GlmU-related protein [Bacteroidales bacterium]|jgi:acetyltransferase-like isoleucine patch superfamily enzyme
MKEKIKLYLQQNPKLKQLVLDLWVHPYSARTRWWARVFVYPLIIKRGKGSIIRRTARLDLNATNKLVIGTRSIIEDDVIINNGIGDVIIGKNTMITSRGMILGPITIGDNVVSGIGTQLVALTHSYENIDIPIKKQGVKGTPITIGNDVWIGGNCIILQGVTIGTHSLVAAGSVVTKNVASYTIVAGNPAREIKKYDFELKEWVKVKKIEYA